MTFLTGMPYLDVELLADVRAAKLVDLRPPLSPLFWRRRGRG